MEDFYRMMPWHSHDRSPAGMTAVEIQALYQCREELVSSIDPILLVGECNMLPLYVKNDVIKMFQDGRDRIDICECLISHLPANINLQALVTTLDGCGYRKLATKLFLTFLKLNMQTSVKRVYRSTSGQRSSIHTFFSNVKLMLHDSQIKNPIVELRRLGNRFIAKMEMEENAVRKQILADKCVAIVGLEIDAIAITFDNNLSNSDAFLNMRRLIPYTSNTLVTDVVYFGRLANANSIIGNFEDSESLLVEARCRAYSTGPCLELVNMLYIEVYVKLWQFERNPTREIREALMRWGRIGLESLEEEEMGTQIMWRRMFILRMVFCLLGLGNRSNVIEGCTVDEDCKREARELLAEIDKKEIWDGIDNRRQMFYYVARARLFELDGNPEFCIQYLKKAQDLALNGRFTVYSFITLYLKTVSEEMMQQKAKCTHRENLHVYQTVANSVARDPSRELAENFPNGSVLEQFATIDSNIDLDLISKQEHLMMRTLQIGTQLQQNNTRQLTDKVGSEERDVNENINGCIVAQQTAKANRQTDVPTQVIYENSNSKATTELTGCRRYMSAGNFDEHDKCHLEHSETAVKRIVESEQWNSGVIALLDINRRALLVGRDEPTRGNTPNIDHYQGDQTDVVEHLADLTSETNLKMAMHCLQDSEMAENTTHDIEQRMAIPLRVFSPSLINSIALFEDRGEPSGTSKECEMRYQEFAAIGITTAESQQYPLVMLEDSLTSECDSVCSDDLFGE